MTTDTSTSLTPESNASTEIAEIRELSLDEIDAAAGAGWFRDAWNWVKEHVSVTRNSVSVKGTF